MEKTHEIGISKFKNINGVTCYMNSILAILQQVPIFSDYIISGKFKEYLKSNEYSNLISYHLYKLFRISMSMDDANLTPTSLRKVCADKDFIWGEHQQQDSAEYLQFVITKMEEEMANNVDFLPGLKLNKQYLNSDINESLECIQAINGYQRFTRKEFSPLKKFFTGLEETKSNCKICSNVKNNYQTFIIWQLPIPVTEPAQELQLEDCMDKWFENETLDDENRSTCDFCGVKSNAGKSNSIFMPPKILVIQLKRFKKDMYGQVCRKITNKVNYPITDLDISKYISNSSCYKDNYKYNLIGVNIHQELGSYANINLGHYVSIVKNRYDNKWLVFNDDYSPRVITSKDELINNRTYLLFYCREN